MNQNIQSERTFAKRQLSKLDYVSKLTVLTPIEREILLNLYDFHYVVYKQFPICMPKGDINGVGILFDRIKTNITSYLNSNNFIRYYIYSIERGLQIRAIKFINDQTLIKRHLKRLKDEKRQKDAVKKAIAENNKRKEQLKNQQTVPVSKEEAQRLVSLLQNKFGI